jgi:adenine-specific DNA-methyltransferase
VYAADWKDGKAANHSTGISHAFKVLKLESYEDTLNNLELTRPNTDLFEHMTPEQQNDYLMHYMLRLESKDSLLSVKQFQKPFSYQLNITTDSAGAYQKRTVDLVETFNYLLGLRVKHIDMQQHKGYVQVVGHLPTGEHTCILWRDCDTLPYAKLDSLLAKLHINPNDREYDLIYINGDHNIPSVYIGSDGSERQLKVRSIEHEFFARMFAESM